MESGIISEKSDHSDMNRYKREAERQTDTQKDRQGACLHGHESSAALGLRPVVAGQWSRLQGRVCVCMWCVLFSV